VFDVKKGKFHRKTGHEVPEGEWRYSSTLCLISALDGGGWSMLCSDCFIPRKETQYPLYRRLGGPRASLDRCRIRSPDCPACNELLYWLHCPAPLCWCCKPYKEFQLNFYVLRFIKSIFIPNRTTHFLFCCQYFVHSVIALPVHPLHLTFCDVRA
jgi:hypothetical protein